MEREQAMNESKLQFLLNEESSNKHDMKKLENETTNLDRDF